MAKLVADMCPTADDATLRTLAAVAADVYLEHVDEVAGAERARLLVTVLEEVVAEHA
jgi:hypothetical protein